MFCCGDPWSVPTVSKVLLSCFLISSLSLFQAVHTLIALQKRYLNSLGKLTPAEEDSVWQVIIGQRAKVSLHCSLRLEVFKEKHLVLFFSSFFVNVTTDLQTGCCRSVWVLFWFCPDRLMTDRKTASISSQPGSVQWSSVKQQLRPHTHQVCCLKKKKTWAIWPVWYNSQVVVLRQVLLGFIFLKLSTLPFVVVSIQVLTVLHLDRCMDHLLSLCRRTGFCI